MDVIDPASILHWSDQPRSDDASADEMSHPSSSKLKQQLSTDKSSITSRETPPSFDTLSSDLLALLRCALCRDLLIRPVTLPCGRTICQDCLPEASERPLVSYPDDSTRRKGFACPISAECRLEHCTADVNRDFVLQSVVEGVVGWWPSDSKSQTGSEDRKGGIDSSAPATVESRLVAELTCLICHTLFASPLTTCCGHTFCRPCLVQTSMGSPVCPICRHMLPPVVSLSQQNTNRIISQLLKLVVAVPPIPLGLTPDMGDNDTLITDIPTFICTLSFPSMPTYLHIFEPRYRRMLARVLQSSPPVFAMVGHHSVAASEKAASPYGFCQIGTMLEIVSVQMARDGRSVVETTGRWRFAVERSAVHNDGYLISDVRRLDDISVADEEAAEIVDRTRNSSIPTVHLSEKETVVSDQAPENKEEDDDVDSEDGADSVYFSTSASTIGGSDTPFAAEKLSTLAPPGAISQQLLSTLPTLAIFTHCTSFISEMQSRSASWLRRNVLASVGPMPANDPVLFTWWFASVMPVSEQEKYRLLQLRSVRERLLVCAEWVSKARERMYMNGAGSGSLGGGYRMLGGGSSDMCAAM